MKLGAFIITFERTVILQSTIEKIFSQTFPPEEILIVDNSIGNNTFEFFQKNNIANITYHRMGYNAGPAGAANYALQNLNEKGYEWIFWGDDDDPPSRKNDFEELLKLASTQENIGIVGIIGGKFIGWRARTRAFYNKELNGIVNADFVNGGYLMIINSEVIKKKILPSSKLFFGFEELEFCLRIKDAGFRIIFDGDQIIESRRRRGINSPNYKWRGKSFGDKKMLWRNYYSIRNMLYVLKTRKIFSGYLFLLLKSLAKIPLSYKYGFNYGLATTKINFRAIWHHLRGIYGYQEFR